MKKIIALTLALSLAACAGRDAKPVAFSKGGDQQLSCTQLHDEVRLNDEQAQRLLKKKKSTTTKNVVVGVIGVAVFLPALFFLDLKQAEKEELQALINRNKHLAAIAKKKGCPIVVKEVS